MNKVPYISGGSTPMFKDGAISVETDSYGNKFWYINAIYLHRVDGPAIEGLGGHNSWWLNGVEVTPEEVLEQAAAKCDEKAIENILWSLR